MKKIKHEISSKKLMYVVVGVIAILLATNKSTVDFVKAGASDVGGWAWGGTTSSTTQANSAYKGIGWLSFSNISDGSPRNYGVNVPSGDGAITGNAWSEHYGWLSFNAADVSDCPSNKGANITGNNITGWARFLSIKNAMNTDPDKDSAGGWNGCVSLSSTNMNDPIAYGVTRNSGVFGGYAWSPEFGWINFDLVGNTLNTKTVTISAGDTIKLGGSKTFESDANFGDGSMIGHNIKWRKSGSSCWGSGGGCLTNGTSTLTNSTSVFSQTASHKLSNVVFTPASIGTYEFYASASSSSAVASSSIVTVKVTYPGCDYFGTLVDTGTAVTSYSASSAVDCSTIDRSSTCQNTGLFVPPLLTYKICTDIVTPPPSGVATPISISVSSATINPGDNVSVVWNIENPNSTCKIVAVTASTTENTRLNNIFSSGSQKTDANDPYGGNRLLTDVISPNVQLVGNVRGKRTVQLYIPTRFELSCNGSTLTDKQIQVNVTKNLEG